MQAFYMSKAMINTPSKDIENQENKNSVQEGFFDDEANKEGLADIQKEKDNEKKTQTKKAKKLKNLLTTKEPMEQKTSIARIPLPNSYYLQRKGVKINEVPDLDEDEMIDCNGYDISNIDIKKYKDILPKVNFDTQTKRPKDINKYFNPEKRLEIGKNPGLNVKKIHEKGITGKNINIAIVDQTLLVDHQEYKDQVKMYDEIDEVYEDAQMHGPAVASLAVGKNCGVAPEANLYYIAVKPVEEQEDKTFVFSLSKFAKGIEKIVEKNESLRENEKIRVISISLNLTEIMDKDPEKKAYKMVESAIKKAEEKGIYVIHTGDEHFTGAGRNPDKDPDDFGSYTKGGWRKSEKGKYKNCILIPMDSRTVASPIGEKEYSFYPEGGLSWTVPYVAGIYALCCQVKPEINKDMFWEAVHKTSKKVILDDENFGIINPVELIEYLEKLQ